MLRNFELLPRSLRLVFLVFLYVPIVACFLTESPSHLLATRGALLAGVALLAYWVLPLLFCLAILVKRYWFLPLFSLECAVLATHCFLFRNTQSVEALSLRALLIGLMALLSLLCADRDFLSPFLSRAFRAWRGSRRLVMRRPVGLHFKDGKSPIPAELHDLSLSGMGMEVSSELFKETVRSRQAHCQVDVEIELSSGRYVFPTTLVWHDVRASQVKLGLRFQDPQAMAPFVASVTGIPNRAFWQPWQERFAYYWIRGHIQHVVLAVWVLTIAGAFFLS